MVYSLPTHTELVANIKSVYFDADSAQLVDGSNWYSDAANLARSLSNNSRYSVAQTAGVIAALSPNTGWGQNVRLAIRMIESEGKMRGGALGANIAKASAILDTEFEHEIAAILFGKNANKVLAFWRGIMADGKTEEVCIDRHAFCIAVNSREMTNDIPDLTKNRYAAIAAAYREAAIGTPFTAAQVQAITWVVWRNRHWSKGAFDGK